MSKFPPKCQVEGVCIPNRTNYGYYQSTWRRWPGDDPGAKLTATGEPTPASTRTLPPVELPRPEEEESAGLRTELDLRDTLDKQSPGVQTQPPSSLPNQGNRNVPVPSENQIPDVQIPVVPRREADPVPLPPKDPTDAPPNLPDSLKMDSKTPSFEDLFPKSRGALIPEKGATTPSPDQGSEQLRHMKLQPVGYSERYEQDYFESPAEQHNRMPDAARNQRRQAAGKQDARQTGALGPTSEGSQSVVRSKIDRLQKFLTGEDSSLPARSQRSGVQNPLRGRAAQKPNRPSSISDEPSPNKETASTEKQPSLHSSRRKRSPAASSPEKQQSAAVAASTEQTPGGTLPDAVTERSLSEVVPVVKPTALLMSYIEDPSLAASAAIDSQKETHSKKPVPLPSEQGPEHRYAPQLFRVSVADKTDRTIKFQGDVHPSGDGNPLRASPSSRPHNRAAVPPGKTAQQVRQIPRQEAQFSSNNPLR